ncbi:MAG: endolytic transglycosylase MltG [Oscillospiraceae bacterium]|nr:endolytic transglycosylase MltG [Oscillospiraceae bacterium]
MDQQNNNKNNGATPDDTYEVLHKNFSLFGDEPVPAEESDVKNSGEIYFSANDENEELGVGEDYDLALFSDEPRLRTSQTSSNYSPLEKRARVKKQAGSKSAKPQLKKTGKKKKSKKKSSTANLLVSMGVVVFVIVLALLVRIPILGCMNDVLAIDRPDTQIRVILENKMSTSDLLDLLDDKGLIYSSDFCKLISRFLGYTRVLQSDGTYKEREYPAGTYYLSSSMGVEGMLREIITSGQEQSVVTLTFPEGYTIDQIVERLALNGVASENALYEVINSESFYEQYEFLSYIEDKAYRYRNLEGYLYPDTYEFYYGENPESVINKFLSNFNDKWNENFAALAENSNYNIDDIITVASILQKEASDADQMKVISSIIYNRLQSSSFPFINCDSTAKYITAHEEELKEMGSYVTLRSHYDTYQITGLPVGPICSPGLDAIAAAVSPAKTNYYYFLHDGEGNIYLATTAAEHEYNQRYLGN